MAAAYAALVSLSHILRQILHLPPTLDFVKIPTDLIVSLQDEVGDLMDFLEKHSSSQELEDSPEEKRIVDAAHEAEDIIESEVVNQIGREKMSSSEEIKGCLGIQMHQGLQKVIEKFIFIHKLLPTIKNSHSKKDISSSSLAMLASGSDSMVGFDEHLNQIREVLASDDSHLQIVPIVGMGGTGKTTLATNVFKDRYIVEMFDVRAFISVSQEYMVREIILVLLQQIDSFAELEGNADELGGVLHKKLYGRRYFIVLDDMWDIKAWDMLKIYLPNNCDRSRILVTTRLLNVAEAITSCRPYQMSLLDEEHSWELIQEKVFGKETCPVELHHIGRRIAGSCGGLPLGLVVIGGLLAKSEKTKELWEYIAENVSSAANSENDDHCLKVLRLSYRELPLHLKPCFLYLAVFPKTFEIRRSRLIRLWVAEGFIKPTGSQSLEDVGEGYFKDLTDRNLIIVGKRGHTGKVKNCRVHDLILDLCTREVHKSKFLCISKLDDPNTSPQLENECRLSIHRGTASGKEVLSPTPLNRSYFNYAAASGSRRCVADGLDLLRVLDTVDSYSMDEIVGLINLRYITCTIIGDQLRVPSFISMLWSLQTLVLTSPISLPPQFWQMPHVRHLKMPEITLPDVNMVESGGIIVLEHLQTLSTVKDFIFKKQMLKRIPNLKKLGIDCNKYKPKEMGYFCLSNLAALDKLESLVLAFRGTWENIDFPVSLRKLTLSHCEIPWEDMYVVGSLPNLEVLKLKARAAKGRIWNPNVGEFRRLKFLLISHCDLEIWGADDSHFPSLEHLQLTRVRVEEFPMDFAQIQSLQIIELNYCSRSLSASAKRMSNERDNLGYEDVQVRSLHSADAAVESLLQNLKMLMVDHAQMIQGAEGHVEKLFKYLKLLKTGEVETDLGDIRGIVNEAQDAIDVLVLKVAGRRSKYYVSRMISDPISKIIALLRKLDGVLGKKSGIMDFTNLKINDEDLPEYWVRESREAIVVGFEDEVEKIKGYISEESHKLDIIPIIGMPGLGKTTLAGKIFQDPQIQDEFPTRIWVHVCRDFSRKHVFHAILKQLTTLTGLIESKTDYDLAVLIVCYLENMKFLLVMDDIWSCEDWDKLRIALPKSNKLGKVLITSHQAEVGWHVNPQRRPHTLRSLTVEESCLLLQMEVFGKPEFPPDLENEGVRIAEGCEGLPLAIMVIAGTLKRRLSGDMTVMKMKWESLFKSFDTYLDDEDLQKRMEKIISLSYEKFPDQLRECFLYFGMFPDGFEIPVRKLVGLWIAEGFIQQNNCFLSLEETAENYLEELINRNLVRTEKLKLNGKVKTCRIHKVLREFCLNEARVQGEMFLQEIKIRSDGDFEYPISELLKFRRLSIHSNVLKFLSRKPYGPSVRSFVCFTKDEIIMRPESVLLIPEGFKLLRILDAEPIKFPKFVISFFDLFQLRYLVMSSNIWVLPPALSALWNIQTLVVNTTCRILDVKADILNMIQLRYFKTNASANLLKRSKSIKGAGEKIRTLTTISPESCTEEVFSRARNLKKLGVRGKLAMLLHEESGSFDNLGKLGNLENLKLLNDEFPLPPSEGRLDRLPPAYKFPPKLRILTLSTTRLDWHHMSIIGSLEYLEVLKLKEEAFVGKIWEATDVGFRHLEVLHIGRTNLKIWLACGHHFPRLKHLQLNSCEDLQQVPIELADVPNFQKLDLYRCELAASSAKKIEAKIKEENKNLQPGSAVRCRFSLSIFSHEK